MRLSTEMDMERSGRVLSGGLVSLALATVLSFSAGVGSTLVYLHANSDEPQIIAPLVEAEKGPTRIRPEGLDQSGNPVAQTSSFSATSTALARAAGPSESVGPSPADEFTVSLPVQGVPTAPDIVLPPNAKVVAELTPTESKAVAAAPAAPQYRLQLASFRTVEAARTESKRLEQRFGREFTNTALSVVKSDQGSRGMFFRVLSDSVGDRETARALCQTLSSQRTPCAVLAAAPVVQTQVAAVRPVKASSDIAAQAPQSARATAPIAATTPAAKMAAAVPPAPADTAAKSAAVRAQLGSMRSRDGAAREATRLSKVYSEVLSDQQLTVSKIDQGDRGIFYRILTAPFPSRAEAGELCQRLEGNHAGCVLVQLRPNDA
jgi:hypothetical protein